MQRSAFCYIDDKMKQFQDHPVFLRKNGFKTLLFLEDSIVEIAKVYVFRYDEKDDIIHLWYDSGEYSSPKRIQIHRAKRTTLNVVELYEWLVPYLCPEGSGVHSVSLAKPVTEPVPEPKTDTNEQVRIA